jgi:intraflagellar transport protein 80
MLRTRNVNASLILGMYIFDVNSGKQVSEPIKHTQAIIQVSLNKSGDVGQFILLLDANRDLYISRVLQPLIKKLGSMVNAFSWHETQDLIYTLMDGKSVIWYYPNTIFVDEDILHLTNVVRDAGSFGSNASCVTFEGSSCIVRRADGALVSVGHISPLPGLLQGFAKKKQWEQAIRLCRTVIQST